MLSAYGGLAGSCPDYGIWFGLLLNCERQLNRQSWAINNGISLALGKARVPPAIFEAVAGDRQEAENMAGRANLERLMENAMKKHGW